MTLELAQRTAECLLALAFVQQALEHRHAARDEQFIYLPRILFAAGLLAGIQPLACLVALVVLACAALWRYDGPYNGGSDRMGYLILFALCAARAAPTPYWREVALGYLAVQVVLSYAWSGWVKLVNPEWRRGIALVDVFAWSAYPVSGEVRAWSTRPRLLLTMAWAVLVCELAFPLALLDRTALLVALVLAASFHTANAWLFGLNRFVWVWIASYPVLLWFQGRLHGAIGG